MPNALISDFVSLVSATAFICSRRASARVRALPSKLVIHRLECLMLYGPLARFPHQTHS